MWRDEYSASLDDLRQAWLPDTYHVYGDKLHSLGMDDTRTIDHDFRFFMSNNMLHPRVYQVTKINDITPQGIIKLSIKQDEINEKRDNFELQVCDYYTNMGECQVEENNPAHPDVSVPYDIYQLYINQDGELDYSDVVESSNLHLGQTAYFGIQPEVADNNLEWQIHLKDDAVPIKDKEYYEGLIKIERLDNYTVSVRPSKAHSLLGQIFVLSLSSPDAYSTVELEVLE